MILRIRWIPTECLVLALLVVVPASGQEQKYPIQAVNFLKLGGKLSFENEIFREDRESPDLKTREKKSLWEENAELNFRGYFYHPNLVEWFGLTRFTLTQEQHNIDDQGLDSNGSILDYNLSAIILREKPISFRVFAADATNNLNREFEGPFELRTQERGFEAYTRGPFPLSFLLENSESNEVDDIREDDQRTTHLNFRIADRRDRNWFTMFVYDRESTDETITNLGTAGEISDTQDLSFGRDEFKLSNNWRFGPKKKKSSLSGNFRVLRRVGFYPEDLLSANQRLKLQHSETFSTFYKYYFSDIQTENSDEKQLEGEVGFTKEFYESLDITGRLYFRDREFIDGIEDYRGSSIGLDYRKKTPLGFFISAFDLSKEFEKETSTSDSRLIHDENIVLTGINFSSLSDLGIVPGTIVVTNNTKTITYVENVDYTVRTLGEVTEIARILGGSIIDGQTVLVDYAVQSSHEATFATNRISWTNRLRLKHLPLSVYSDYRLNDQQLVSGDDPGNLERDKLWLGGIKLDYKGLTASVEYEVHDLLLSPPTITTRGDINYRKRFNRNLNLIMGGKASKLRYLEVAKFGLEPGRDFQDNYTVYAHIMMKLSRNMLLRVETDYMLGRGYNNETIGRIGAIFEWKYGKLDFSIEAWHKIYTQESTSGEENLLRFGITRRF